MDNKKHENYLKSLKFEALMFAMDYIRSVQTITNDIDDEDFISCLIRVYDEAFAHGARDILDRHLYLMHSEIDEIEDQMNNKA